MTPNKNFNARQKFYNFLYLLCVVRQPLNRNIIKMDLRVSLGLNSYFEMILWKFFLFFANDR